VDDTAVLVPLMTALAGVGKDCPLIFPVPPTPRNT
jgi:hypothetical protein